MSEDRIAAIEARLAQMEQRLTLRQHGLHAHVLGSLPFSTAI